jgi:hypothetical protein
MIDLLTPRQVKEILFFVRDRNNIILARFTAWRVWSVRCDWCGLTKPIAFEPDGDKLCGDCANHWVHGEGLIQFLCTEDDPDHTYY